MDLKHPLIIQGGMGIGASNWKLARTVSLAGQLGMVSGVGLDTILARRLQDGDPEGHMRRALAQFPAPEIAERILQSWFIPGGKAPDAPYRFVPMHTAEENIPLWELAIAGNFVEVFLAREGHDGAVGINYLEKIQLPNIPAFYGAMLAGVDYIIMGAGIPRENPGYIDRLAEHRDFTATLQVEGAASQDAYSLRFDPKRVISRELPPLKRPLFLAIISSAVLAITLAKKATGRVDGFVIEGPSAGGHNAPPRGESTTQYAGRAGLRSPGRSGTRKNPETGVAFLAGGFLRRTRNAQGSARARSGRNPGGNAVRFLPRVRNSRRHQGNGHPRSAQGQGRGVQRPARLAERIPVQGGRTERIRFGEERLRIAPPYL